MQPKDFSKRKFKMVPGADYSEGPISKYGTFGNMMRTRTIAGLKKSADNIPMSAADLTGENIEQITDFVNPMSGSMKFIKGISSIKPSKSVVKTRFEDPYFKQGVEDHINDKNRNAFADSEQRTYFENLSPHMKPYHSGDPIYRGMSIQPDDEILQLKDGDYFMSDRAMPFSRSENVAGMFSYPTTKDPNGVYINLPKPKSGIDMWDLRHNNAWDESEVTIPANAKFKVSEVMDESDKPMRRMTFEEVDTIPEGSRLLHYRNDKGTDYTNDDMVQKHLLHLDERIVNAKDKNLPRIEGIIQREKDAFLGMYKESQLNRPEGAEGSTGIVPKFIAPREQTFAEKFKVSESTPEDKVIDGILEQFHD